MGMDNEPSSRNEITRTIVMLAHNLGIQVVAEGVETAEQLAQLRQLGCEYGQGFLFSKPLSREDAEALILQQPRW
jgi:EAL domain-containing protein (putative c-di-GMP-specific phosphodiesterase class I)